MDTAGFFLLMAAIYVAPHMNKRASVICGVISFIVAVVAAVTKMAS